ncbi:ABC transporter permease [Halobacteriaceae archaeon GCM10025711]
MTEANGPEADGGVTTTETGFEHPTATETEDETTWWRQMSVVAGQEYHLSIRNRWAFALTGLFILLAGLLTVFSGSRVGPSGFDVMVVSLASLATYLIPLAALVFGYDAIVGADQEGWLDVVFALPVARSTVVFGKYLGRAVTLTAATAIGFGAAGVLLLLQLGLVNWGAYATFLLSAVGVGLAFLAMSVLISSLAAEKTHALGIALVVWLWFVLVHDLVALGVISVLKLPSEVLSAFVLANPADIFRVIVLQSVEARGGGFAAVFSGTELSLPILVVGLVAWCVVPVLVAGRLVSRRSL